MDSLISFVGGGDLNLDQSMKTGDFSKALEEFSERYPSIKTQLIDRRDAHMSVSLVKLFRTKKYDRIIAVVGEGHIEGISTRLSFLNPEIVRLKDLCMWTLHFFQTLKTNQKNGNVESHAVLVRLHAKPDHSPAAVREQA